MSYHADYRLGNGPAPAGASPAFNAARCNPYGHETGGPKHLFGGLFSSAAEGPYKWTCQSRADGRYVMYCPAGHTGPVIELCYAHVYMIGKRMAGVCTRCAMPEEAREVWEDLQRQYTQFTRAKNADDQRAMRSIALRIEDLNQLSVEQVMRGIVRKIPMQLREIS